MRRPGFGGAIAIGLARAFLIGLARIAAMATLLPLD
jgi:hypothetical protein